MLNENASLKRPAKMPGFLFDKHDKWISEPEGRRERRREGEGEREREKGREMEGGVEREGGEGKRVGGRKGERE